MTNRRGHFTCGVIAVVLLAVAFNSTSETTQAAEDAEYEWKLVTMKAPWMGRDGAGILSFKGELFLLGGWNPGNRAVFPMI